LHKKDRRSGILFVLLKGMAQNDDQEKTEEPTAHKLKKAREEGNVAKSTEISSVMLLVIATVIFLESGGWMYGKIQQLFEVFFANSGQAAGSPTNTLQFLKVAGRYGLTIMAPLLVGLFIVAILVSVAQTGVVFAPKAIEFKGDRLNPASGFKKIFSVKGLVELVKGFSKILLIGLIIYFTLRYEIGNIVSFLLLPIGRIISESGGYILTVITRMLSALLVLAIMDAAYKRYQHRKDLRMTRQEVKDEMKQMEGDPHMKSRRKEKAASMHRRRLDHAVLGSEVVVTNPTHYAVALHYDPQQTEAPIIKAKGMRNRALKIKEFADKYEVPIVENKPTARALYASAEEGEYVPPELYKAVAEILAYVYKLNDGVAA
jgi:flagellar biosynthetic protein FlhB